MAWAQYNAGIVVSILKDTTTKLPHLESVYLASLRDYLAATGGSLELNGELVVPKQRDHDEFLMTVAVESKQFKPAQLKRINYCRMYLNVLMVSDIATAKGDYIEPLMFSGKTTPVITNIRSTKRSPLQKLGNSGGDYC